VLKQQHQLFVALLVAVDGVVIVLASFAAWGIRLALITHNNVTRWDDPIKKSLVLYTIPITLLCMRAIGLYRPRRDRSLLSEVKDVAQASVLSLVALLPALYVFDSSIFHGYFSTITFLGVKLDAGRVQLGS
jgi:ABC-type proline/glycine betaine transport system permease subunit